MGVDRGNTHTTDNRRVDSSMDRGYSVGNSSDSGYSVGYHTGVSHGVYPYTAFRAGVTHAVPTVTGVTHAVPSVHAGVYSPVVRRVGVSSVYPNVYSNMYSNVYSGLNHVYCKREAEGEPEANHHFYSNLYHPYTTYTGVHNVVPAVHAGVYNYNYPVHGVYYG